MLRSLGHPEQIHPEDESPKRAPLGELLRACRISSALGSYDLRAESLLRRHESAHARRLARITAVDPRTLSDRGDLEDGPAGGSTIAPEAIQAVFVMSGVLIREDVADRKACKRRRLPLRAARLHAARRRRAVGEHAAGDRSRRARRASRATSRARMKYLARERRHVRRLPHRARRHGVPRALRSVPRSLRPSRPLRVGLGAAAAARESGAGAVRRFSSNCRTGRRISRRSPSGRKPTRPARGARSRRG